MSAIINFNYFFILINFTVLGLGAKAQTTSGPAKSAYEVTYNQIFNFNAGPDTTTGILRGNSKYSLYSYGIDPPKEQKTYNYIGKDGQLHQGVKAATKGDSIGLCVYKDFLQDEMISREKAVNQYFIVRDTLNQIRWSLTRESKLIKGYKAIKAEGVFHGRNYVVWYTKDLPVKNGPWKLSGLPGLILRAKDTTGEIEFIVTTIVPLKQVDLNIAVPGGYPLVNSYALYKVKENELEKKDMAKGMSYISKSGNGKKVSVTFKISKLEM